MLKKKIFSKFFLPSFLLTVLFLFILCNESFAQQGAVGIFDRIGIIPEHGFNGAVPEEN